VRTDNRGHGRGESDAAHDEIERALLPQLVARGAPPALERAVDEVPDRRDGDHGADESGHSDDQRRSSRSPGCSDAAACAVGDDRRPRQSGRP
jgi:hypothetical protein